MAEAPDINVDELRRRARRRLIGAIVLALAAAVIVPMLLESDPKPLGEDVSVKIPQQDNDKFVNRLSDKGAKPSAVAPAGTSEPVKAPPKPEAAPAPDAAPEPKASVSNLPPPKKSIATAEQKMLGGASKPAGTVPSSAPSAVPPPAPAPAVISAAPPASTGSAATPAPVDTAKPATMDGYSVQLAAFADDKGANALANKLKKAAYPAYTEPLTTSKGTLWRVRVGPYPSRESAIDVRDKLKSEGYSGIVAAPK
jgi:DedD protein